VDDFDVAEAAYRATVAGWPAARITLRQGARIVHESGSRNEGPIRDRRERCSGMLG
jgi:hypothetical protein